MLVHNANDFMGLIRSGCCPDVCRSRLFIGSNGDVDLRYSSRPLPGMDETPLSRQAPDPLQTRTSIKTGT